jgi:dipeptidyl aminopeptidase/acylaminoacyl peptidase
MNKKLALLFTFTFLLFTCVSVAQDNNIERYLNIRSAGSPTFNKDASKIAYLTNITGTNQIWLVDANGGYPEQLTSYQDNIGFVKFSPSGDWIAFGKAKGGDENTQLFLMSPDGSTIKQLTTDEKVRYNFGDWSADGTKIYYASNKRNRTFFDVYSMNINDGKETLIYQQDGNNDFVAADNFDNRIIVSRSSERFSLDNDLYLIEVESKQVTHLTPHDEATQYGNVHFVADGIVFAQNDKREFYSLSQLRQKNAADSKNWIESNRETRILDDTNADVDSVEMLPYANTIAYTLNREGYSELYLRKFETGGKPLITTFAKTSEMIKLPAKGVVGGLTFSDDKTKLAFTFNSAKFNSDIWTYDLESKKLTQVTKSSRSGLKQESFVEPQLIKYKSFDGKEVSAWYYIPNFGLRKGEYTFSESYKDFDKQEKTPQDTNTATKDIDKSKPQAEKIQGGSTSIFTTYDGPSFPFRVIVSVHGGPEGQERPSFNPLYQYYLSRGYAVLATNVRGSTGYGKTFTHLDDVRKREDSVKDLAFAVEWLKTNGSVDAKKIAVTGGSYGGYMTLAAITLYPELWAAAVDTVGIANWESFLKNTSGYRRKQREVEYGSLEKDLDFLRSISPLAKVDKIKCPLFVIQGKNDPRVPYTEAEQIVEALKKRGAIVQYKLYDDEGHGISKLKNRLDLYPQVADFLDKYMK